MEIVRDATFLNSVANHPEVRPHLGGSGLIDLRAGIANHSILGFQNSEGGFVLHPIRPQGYEIHTIFLPGCNLRGVITLAHEMLNEMFISHDCERLFTQVPANNQRAMWLAKHCGLRELMVRKGAWDGEVDVHYLDLPLDRWLPACSTHQDQGRLFARKLGAREDVVLERVLGGVIEMFRAGNMVKGVNTFNMWAAFCVQPQMVLLSEEDATIEFMGRRWGLCYEGLEVLQCH